MNRRAETTTQPTYKSQYYLTLYTKIHIQRINFEASLLNSNVVIYIMLKGLEPT